MLTTAKASLYLDMPGAALAFGVTTSDLLLLGGGGAMLMLPGVAGADELGVVGENVVGGGAFAFAFVAARFGSGALDFATGREDPNMSKLSPKTAVSCRCADETTTCNYLSGFWIIFRAACLHILYHKHTPLDSKCRVWLWLWLFETVAIGPRTKIKIKSNGL